MAPDILGLARPSARDGLSLSPSGKGVRTMLHLTALQNRLATVSLVAVGAALAVSSFSAVYADNAKPIKKKTVFNCSTGTACLEGDSSGASSWGVYGIASTADGVHGVT